MNKNSPVLIDPTHDAYKPIQSSEELEKRIIFYKNRKIIVFDSCELVSRWGFEYNRNLHRKIELLTKRNNLFIDYWISNLEFPRYTFFDNINTRLINWELSWAYFTYFSFEHNHIDRKPEFKNLYVCMNNKPHTYRCVFIDTIFKKGAENLGVLSWNMPEEARSFQHFRYFKNRRINLDNFVRLQERTPIEYIDSLFDVVTETSWEVRFLSEKTFRPILYKKPFLIFGANGLNKKLEELGFKLFHNLFDYSFDDINSMIVKSEKIIDQIIYYKNYDYEEIRKDCKNIIEHNYNKLLEIINDPLNIPKEFWESKTLERVRENNPVYRSISEKFRSND